MERKIFISFLGITNYTPTNYYYQSLENKIDNVRFIQEASVRLFCNDWNENDRIIILVTKDSKEKNWFDNVHLGRETKQKILSEGLNTRLNKLNLKPKHKYIKILEGNNEEEIWDIFIKIYEEIEQDDKICFDITHSFRFLPMLNMVLINYAKFLKNSSVEKITYGNWEGRDKENNNSPIVDITSLSNLQDWTSAANEFINNGCSYQLDKIIKEKAKQKTGAEKQNLQKFNKELSKLLLSFSTVRGKEIYSGNIFKNLNNKIDKVIETNTLEPLLPIITKIKNKINNYSTEYNIENGEKAIEWCVEHKLIQQAFTLGQEHIISVLCNNFSLDYTKKENREIVSSTLGIINRKNDISRNNLSKVIKDNYNLFEDLKENQVFKDLAKNYGELSRFRNSINHAGMIGNIQADSFENNFNTFYLKIIDTLRKHKIIS